uniref:Glycosyltransferase involved in cell wall bisynthesis n=1 Tax=Candidatus Kentrum sp. SD TaxID=2126332 RepID=A0A451BI92_9GAMM|nr:MAG: Glycosyltransferase involved in cell wall bisynthesis [Candidatus Kentron sp. SD]
MSGMQELEYGKAHSRRGGRVITRSKPMHIVQILPELDQGGVERGTVEVNRELVRRGHDSTVISAGGKLVRQIEAEGGKHIALDVCSKNPLTVPFRTRALRARLQALRPDILHARSRVPAWLSHFANKKPRIPFVTTVHGLNSVNPYSRIMTSGDTVICVSEVVRDHIIRHYGTDIQKVRVIQRGVDMNIFDPGKVDHGKVRDLRNRYELNGRLVVSSVGRITWLKDYETFIHAISLVRKKIPHVAGLIVGGYRQDKAEYFESLAQRVAEKRLEKNLFFVGSQEDMVSIYASSDMVVNASLKMGNMGRTVVEALALGKPVIATTFEGLTNLVVDGRNGFVIKNKDPLGLADAILETANASFDANSIRSGIPYDYTLDCMVRQLLKVYGALGAKQ